MAGRPVRSPLGLSLRRLPGLACLHGSSRLAMGLRSAGPQSQKCTDPLGPPVRATDVLQPLLLPQTAGHGNPRFRLGAALNPALSGARWPGGTTSNWTPGLGGSELPLPDWRASTGVLSERALLLGSSPQFHWGFNLGSIWC